MTSKEPHELENTVKPKLPTPDLSPELITEIVMGYLNGQEWYPLDEEQLRNDIFAEMIIGEILSKYDFEGVEFNMWGKAMKGQSHFVNGHPASTKVVIMNKKDAKTVIDRVNTAIKIAKGESK